MKCKNCDHDVCIPFKKKSLIHISSGKKRCKVVWCMCNNPEPKEVENDSKK